MVSSLCIVFTFDDWNLKKITVNAPIIDIVLDSGAALKWFILYKPLQENLEKLEITSNLIILTKFLSIKFPQLQGFPILPAKYFPGKAKLSNIHQLKILVQIVNELECWVGFSSLRLA